MNGVSDSALAAFRQLEELTGGPLKVNSAYRSPEHNAKVGGAKNSQHTHGNAFDVSVSHLDEAARGALIQQAKQAGFKGIGVYDNALHFDVGPERAWGPSYSRDSIPEWAQSYLGAPGPVGVPSGPAQAQPDDRMNRLATLMGAMPQWRNSLSPEMFRI